MSHHTPVYEKRREDLKARVFDWIWWRDFRSFWKDFAAASAVTGLVGLCIVALLSLASCAPFPHGPAMAPSEIIYTRTIPGGHYYPSRQVHTVYRVNR